MEETKQTIDTDLSLEEINKIDAKLDGWKKKLLDLGLRNQLLNFKPSRSSNLKIDLTTGLDSVFTTLVDREKTLKFVPLVEPEKAKDKMLYLDNYESRQRQIHTLRSSAKKSLAEKGINILYMTFGMLYWKDKGAQAQEMTAPLLLVPVAIEHASTFAPYEMQVAEGEFVVNPTLLFKLENDFQITDLPSLGDEEMPEAFIDRFRAALNQDQWHIENEMFVSLLSFQKINMYRDMEQHKERIYKNKIVRALCGVNGNFEADQQAIAEVGSRYNHDALVRPTETFHIVDADASQADAILLAEKGVSFVLQGPPGTGKSQTITNIIATMLAKGKKVLFVAEKEAALSVVQNRLAEHGMGDFCLMIDNDKAKKKDILQQIDNCIAQPKLQLKSDIDDRLLELNEKRARLNQYYEQLTALVEPIKKSIYDMCGEIASRNDIPDLAFEMAHVEEIDADQLRRLRDIVKDFMAAYGQYDTVRDNPWFGATIEEIGINQQGVVTDQLQKATAVVEQIEQSMGEVVLNTGLPIEPSSNNMDCMLDILHLLASPIEYPAMWLTLDSLDCIPNTLPKHEREALRKQHEDLSQQERQCRDAIEQHYDHDVVEVDPAMLDRFRTDYGSMLRSLNAQYRKDISTLASYSKQGKPDYDEALALLKQIKSYTEIKKALETCKSELAKQQPLEQAETMRAKLRQYGLDPEAIVAIIERPSTQELALKAYTRLQQLQSNTDLETVRNFFSEQEWAFMCGDSALPLTERLRKCAAHIDDLRDWRGYRESRKQAALSGIATFINAVEQHSSPIRKQQLEECFLKHFYKCLLDKTLQQEQFASVRDFRHTAIMQLIADFKALDLEQLRITQEKIRVGLIQQIPDFSFSNSAGSEIGILKREIQKKRGQKPLRVLFQQIPNIITHIKPCFLMSPLAISAYLNEMEFDLVIFDEASQVFPENAIGAIMRGKQLIVVGDDRQLPPTNFFKSATLEVEDEDEMDDDSAFESILDQSATVLPTMTLQWHYRSKSESLIAFSNAEIYNNRLISFPTRDITSAGHTPDLGVECIYVPDGVYDRGGKKDNVVEANRIIDLMKDHFTRYPKRSLGVVTFSEAQMDCIETQLLKRLKEDEELKKLYEQSVGREKEPFILKNLENIQGDERDTIIMSVGYGKDSQGKLYNNMGPITRDGGYRRLNVAITRAKYNVKIVCSILPEDIRIDDANNTPQNGLRLLKTYIDYAQRGKAAIENDLRASAASVVDTAFEESVYQFLTQHGYQVDRLVGTSQYRINLAVVNPKPELGYLLAIECDGSSFLSARTARERDRVRPTMLRSMGWQILRLWATDWIINRQHQEERILNAIASALEGNPAEETIETTLTPTLLSEPVASSSPANASTPISANTNGTSTKASSAQCSIPVGDNPFVTYTFAQWDTHLVPKDNIMNMIRTEQPVAFDMICERVLQYQKIQQKVLGPQIRDMLSHEAVNTDPLGFVTTQDYDIAQLKCRIPAEGDKPRNIDCIHPTELKLALVFIASKSFGATRESLITDTARALGFKRTTDIVNASLNHQIDLLLHNETLIDNEGKIVLTGEKE